MSKIAIITDSTAYIPKEYVNQNNLTVVPLTLIWGDETYEDGIDIQPDEFYTRLSTAKILPTTSQPPITKFQTAYSNLLEQGYDVLGIFISHKLSGTYSSAIQGRDALTSGKEKVEIVDSGSVAMELGFHVLAAARAALAGATMRECKEIAENAHKYSGVYFVVDTLEFLHRGGRIGGAQRFVGQALNLKPILTIKDGKVEAIERIRTKSKAVERILEIIANETKDKSQIRLATLQANAEVEGRELLERAAKRINTVESVFTSVSPVVGTHTGPGTIGLAYMVNF